MRRFLQRALGGARPNKESLCQTGPNGAPNNRMLTTIGGSVSYDAAGNMTANGATAYTYDGANRLVQAQRIDPCMSEVYGWHDIPKAHMKMWKNEHRPGNMAVLVSAPRPGLKTFDDVIEAAK